MSDLQALVDQIDRAIADEQRTSRPDPLSVQPWPLLVDAVNLLRQAEGASVRAAQWDAVCESQGLPAGSSAETVLMHFRGQQTAMAGAHRISERLLTERAEEAEGRVAELAEMLHSIWLYIDWRYVTKQLTTRQKNLFADAVDAGSEEPPVADRWWGSPSDTATDDLANGEGGDAPAGESALHRITERDDDRPDLDDLVRLIRYLHEHDIPHAVDGGSTKSFMVRTLPRRWRPHLVAMEGMRLDEARFVGPDGAVYNANREAL